MLWVKNKEYVEYNIVVMKYISFWDVSTAPLILVLLRIIIIYNGMCTEMARFSITFMCILAVVGCFTLVYSQCTTKYCSLTHNNEDTVTQLSNFMLHLAGKEHDALKKLEDKITTGNFDNIFYYHII